MKTITYTVTNPTGIHARPAAFLAQTCVNLSSQITIRCGDRTANGNNALQIMNDGMNTGSVNADDLMDLTPESVRAAAITLSTIPILLLYPQLQKYFVTGIVVGSVKG